MRLLAAAPAGTFSATGYEPCTPCAAGRYSNTPRSTSCSSCPDGQFAPNPTSSFCMFCDRVPHCAVTTCTATGVDSAGFACLSCDAGWLDCDGVASNGCEVRGQGRDGSGR